MEKVSERRMMMKMMMMIGEPATVVGDNRRAMRSAGPRILAYVFPTHTQESNTMTRCYKRGIKTLGKKKHVYQGYLYLYEHEDL
jgi:hypothetical protein